MTISIIISLNINLILFNLILNHKQSNFYLDTLNLYLFIKDNCSLFLSLGFITVAIALSLRTIVFILLGISSPIILEHMTITLILWPILGYILSIVIQMFVIVRNNCFLYSKKIRLNWNFFDESNIKNITLFRSISILTISGFAFEIRCLIFLLF